MTNIIQGSDAVMSFFKDEWLPFMCASDISISLTSDTLPIRTPGDGHWKKIAYQNATFTVTLSGLLIFDAANWTGFDMMDNWLNFTEVLFRCAFSDTNGDTTSIQGSALVTTNTISIAASSLVKNDFDLQGNGPLMIFDGLIPCDSTISTITVAGQNAADGIVHVTYTYTGAPYQVKYRIDGQGNYVYATIGATLDIPSLALNAHTIEIIPVCLNGYEGTGLIQSFIVTQALTCASVCTSIVVTGGAATPTFTGTPSGYVYSIDGAPFVTVNNPSTPVSTSGLNIGSHTITIIPFCSNLIQGTGMTQAFSVITQPAQSLINWVMSNYPNPSNYLQIYVNGILYLNQLVTGSGSFTIAIGSNVRAVLNSNATGPDLTLTLQTEDVTIATILDSRSDNSPINLQYSFTAGGDTYQITGTISP